MNYDDEKEKNYTHTHTQKETVCVLCGRLERWTERQTRKTDVKSCFEEKRLGYWGRKKKRKSHPPPHNARDAFSSEQHI